MPAYNPSPKELNTTRFLIPGTVLGGNLIAQPKREVSPHDWSYTIWRARSAFRFCRGRSPRPLSRPQQLFPKHLYDELGSQLFEAICRVDEYYLTRAERSFAARQRHCRFDTAMPDADRTGKWQRRKNRKVIEALLCIKPNLFIP
jgi:hypothetical protein